MTGPEHHREAEHALRAASEEPDYDTPPERYQLARAQVHATLALAAATARQGLTIRDAQSRAWRIKGAKGFNTTDVALEFGLLVAEVGEAFTAWRHHLPDFGQELADVAIFLLGLAEMTGHDLATEIDRKLSTNAARIYRPDRRGVPVRVADAAQTRGEPA